MHTYANTYANIFNIYKIIIPMQIYLTFIKVKGNDLILIIWFNLVGTFGGVMVSKLD